MFYCTIYKQAKLSDKNTCEVVICLSYLEKADAENYQAKHQYDVVAANILGHLLIKFKNNINTWVKDDGALILAGILNEEFDNLSAEFCAIGYKEIERFSEKEWTSGLFKKIKA